MNTVYRKLATAAVLIAALAAAAAAQEPAPPPQGARIEAVEFSPETATESLAGLLELGAGDAFSPDALRNSIKNIFSLDIYSDVQVFWREGADGIVLTFQLEEIPVIEGVTVLGSAPLSRGAIITATRLDRNPRLDDTREEEIVEQLRELYRNHGFFAADVRVYSMVNLATGGVRVEVSLHPSEPTRLRSIEFLGYPVFEREELLSLISQQAVIGATFRESEWHVRIQRLLQRYIDLNYLSADVAKVEQHYDEDANAIDLEITINAGPLLAVEVAPLAEDKGRWVKMIPFQDRNVPLDRILRNGQARIERELRASGYRNPGARVDLRADEDGLVILDDGSLVVDVGIDKGAPFSVGRFAVEGLPEELKDKALPSLALTKKGWFSRPSFSPIALANDEQVLLQSLRDGGYYQARIQERTVGYDEQSGRADIALLVDPGPQRIVRLVEYQGNAAFADEELEVVAGLRPGDAVTTESVRGALQRLRDHYDRNGYSNADLSATTQGSELTDVAFRIVERYRSVVEKIIIAGNNITSDSVIRRALTFSEGDPFSRSEIDESKRALYRLGIFRRVVVEVLEEQLAERDRRVVVRVEEALPYSMLYGFGLDSEEKFRFSFGISNTNVNGQDIEVAFSSRLSQLQQRYQFSVGAPRLFRPLLDNYLRLFYEEVRQEGFGARRKGLLLESTGFRWGRWAITGRFQYRWVDLFDVVPGLYISRYDREVRLTTLSTLFTRDTRDDLIDPVSGSFTNLILQYSPSWLGSQVDYVKGQFQMFSYNRLSGLGVLASGLRVSLAEPFGGGEVPISERFFAGGITTLRGFGLNEVGPTERVIIEGRLEDVPIGGDALLIGNLELRFPLLENIGGVFFYDVGNVYPRIENISLGNLTHSLGAGLRLGTPLGPLRFDYGNSIFTRDYNFIFTFGHAF